VAQKEDISHLPKYESQKIENMPSKFFKHFSGNIGQPVYAL